ncbi:Proline iminopeptidase, partial [Lachnellula occidentalis]
DSVMAVFVSEKTHLMPGKFEVSEIFFRVPLDYSDLSRGTLGLFARGVTKHERPTNPEEKVDKSQKPWLLWLQGGPGKNCQPPERQAVTRKFLERGYQVLYLDQRGTGLSDPITAETLALEGNAQKQADFLKLFRADNIVRDCEAIRPILTEGYPSLLKKWTIWGQSFGGYCALTYLSFYPEGLLEVFISAGVPPIDGTAETVYTATYPRMIKRNQIYYEKYPEDVESVHNLASYLESTGGVKLPAGGTLTYQRFLQLGLSFGASGGIDTVHNIVLRMTTDLARYKFITRPTLSDIEAIGGYDDHVIYSLLREAEYCNGTVSGWAAERVGRSIKQFSWVSASSSTTSKSNLPEAPLHFSGGMVFPHMFKNFSGIDKLGEVADILARVEWPELYDKAQLAKNEVPLYSATYVDDCIIDFNLAQETMSKIKNCKQFITNTMYHDGVRSKTAEVLEGLWALRDDVLD